MKSIIILAIVMAFHQYDQDSDNTYYAVVISNSYDTKEIYLEIPLNQKKISIGDTIPLHESDFNSLDDTLGWDEGKFTNPSPDYIDDDYNLNEYPINYIAYNNYCTPF
jgi:hypothetical protein